jgi:GDP-D-mannose dehydratase
LEQQGFIDPPYSGYWALRSDVAAAVVRFNQQNGEDEGPFRVLSISFSAVGLNSCDHLQTDSSLLRPSDLKYSAMDPTRIYSALGWKASLGLQEIIEQMMEDSMAC